MNGAQLKSLLLKRSDAELSALGVVVQQGEGEPKEVVGVRTVCEIEPDGEAVQEKLVIKVAPITRPGATAKREALAAEKARAERREPVKKAPTPVPTALSEAA